MRRRQPHWIHLRDEERSALLALIHDGRTPQRSARRARVLLAMEQPETVVAALAERVAMTRSGIWYLCRRYEQEGLAVLSGAPQAGRPRQFSPLDAGAH